MTRNLKALGLALLAVFALGAVMASAASAAPEFEAINNATTEPYADEVTATGFQEEEFGDKFTLNGGELTCKEVHFDGVADIKGSQTKVEVTPTFGKPAINTEYNTGDPNNCHAETPIGKKPVTVTHNECKFNFHPEETTEAGNKNSFVGSVEITGCNKEKPGIEIHIYTSETKHKENISLCTYRVPQQTIKGIHTENVSTEVGGVKQHFVTVKTTAAGAEVTVERIGGTGGLLICGKEHQFAQYHAKDTVDAKDLAGNTRGVTITDP